jgi:hypothetical protein
MSWIKKIYNKVAGHIGKIMGAAGAALLSADISGYGDQIRTYAGQYLGDNAVKKIGIAIFVLLTARTWYTGWKAKQVAAALLIAQAAPSPKVVVEIPLSAAVAVSESVKTVVPELKPVGGG